MGLSSTKTYIQDAIERENVKEVENLLNKYPLLLNESFVNDGVFNCATRATWRGDLNMIKMLH